MARLIKSDVSITVAVKVIPRARKNEIVGWEGDALKVRLTAPPVEGKANAALEEFLSARFNLPRSFVEITAGHSSRHKIVSLRGLSLDRLKENIQTK